MSFMLDDVEVVSVGTKLYLPFARYGVAAWDGPQDPPDLPDGAPGYVLRGRDPDDGRERSLAILAVNARWMVLDTLAESIGVSGGPIEPAPPLSTRWIAVHPPESETSPWFRPRTVGRWIERVGDSWFGEDFRLRPHPLSNRRLRPWWWPLRSPYGARLSLRHKQAEREALEWLLHHRPMPFVSDGFSEWKPGPIPDYNGEDRREFEGWDDPYTALSIHDNTITILQSSGAFDAVGDMMNGLLWELALGALGPVSWCHTYDDSGLQHGFGDGCASLRAHLDPDTDEKLLLARYQSQPRVTF